MNELQKYVDSLPIYLSEPEKIKLIEQWKKDNNWGQEKSEPVGTGTVLKTEEFKPFNLEEVKKGGDVAGAGAEPVQTTAPTGTGFGGEIGSSDLLKKATSFNANEFVYGNEVTPSDEELKGVELFIKKEEIEKKQKKEREEREIAITTNATAEAEQIFNSTLESKKSGRGKSDINVFISESSSKDFNQQMFDSFIAENKIIQEQVIPKATKETDAAVLVYAKQLQEEYELTDPDSFTQEKYDKYLKDVENYYNTTLNSKIAQNKDFQILTSAFDKKTSELSQGYSKSIIRKENKPSILGYDLPEGGMVEAVYRGFVGIDESLKGLARNLSTNESADRNKHFERNLKNAQAYNWTDETVGYFVDDPSRVNDSMRFNPKNESSIGIGTKYEIDGKQYNERQLRDAAKRNNLSFSDYIARMQQEKGLKITKTEGVIPNYKRGKEITWGEFKKLKEENSSERTVILKEKLKDALEEQIIAEAFNNNEFDKITEGIEVGKNVKNLVAGQLPNMAAALLTLGGFTGLTIGSDIYTDSINNRARELREIEARKQGIVLSEQELYAPITAEEQLAVISDEKWNDNAITKASLGGFVGGQLERIGAAKAFKPFATKTIASMLRGNAKKVIKNAAISGGNATKTGLSESVTEFGQTLVQDVASGNKIEPKNYVEASGTGLIVGTVLGGLGNVKTQTVAELKTVANVLAGKLNAKSSEAIFNAEIKKINDLAKIEKDPEVKKELLAKRDAVLEVRNANNKIPFNISEKNKKEALDLLIEKESLTESIKGKDPDLVDAANSRLKYINERLKIIGNEASLDKEIETIKKVAPKGTLKVFNTIAEFVKVAGKENADADAFIDENGVMYINKEQAAKVGAITAASHERLHQILRNVFSNPEAAMKLVDDFKKILSKKELAIVQKRIDANYADASPLKQAEEYLTAFSDAIGKKELNWNDNLGETFKRLGQKIIEIFKGKGYENIEFKDGRDVYNFIKDYQRNVKKGKQDTRTEILSAISEDVTTSEAQKSSTTDTSKPKTEVSKENLETAKENLKVEEEIINIGAFKVSELDGENRTKIVKKLTNLNLGAVKNLAAKAANNPNIQSLEKGKRKTFKDFEQGYAEQLTKIINNYEPIVMSGKDAGKRIPFGAYLQQRLKLRYGNVLTDLKKGEIETTSINTKEAKEIADTPASSSKIIDDKLAKKPSETIKYKSEALKNLGITKKEGETDKDAIENKVSEVIAEAYKGKDVTRFKQTANIPEAVAKLYADMFGITTGSGIKALRVKAQNFPEGDASGVTRARQFLIDNAAADFARIPRTKDDFVKAGRAGGTGVYQTKLGKALYNKSGKLTGSLKNYIDIVSGKNVTVNGIEFNALKNGKKLPIYRDAQHIKAALDFHIRNRVLETLEPTQGKRIQMGAKFSKTKAVNEINIFLENQTFEKVADELAADNKQWKFIANAIGVDVISAKKPEDVAKMQEWVRDVLAPRISKSFFTNGTFANAGTSAAKRNFFFTSGFKTQDGSVGELGILLQDVIFGKDNENISRAVNRQTYVTGGQSGKISEKFIKKFNTKEFKKEQQQKLDGLKDIFKVFETLMKEDKSNASFIIALLGSTSQGMGHFVRTSAPVKFYAKDVSSGIVEEHTMPASLVAKYLFNSAYAGTLNKDFKGIENNYFQGALPFADDKKLKGTKPDGKPFNYTAMTPEGWKITDNIWARYFNINVGLTGGGINPSNIVLSNGKTVYETYNITSTGAKVTAEGKFSRSKANSLDNDLVPNDIAYDKPVTTQTLINALAKTDKALNIARSLNAPVKKIRVFDFDDTLATSKSMVIVNMPNGSSKKINATQFAKQAADLEANGAKFDFTEFSKVVKGKKGPLFNVAQKIANVRGTEDVFILTARPQQAAEPIRAFMKANGIDIPLANITGLGDGTAQAKAGWMMGKAAEGYNDFYFADDAVKNVKAVEDVLSQVDVKSKVQVAKFSKTKTFDTIVNDMIEDSSGIETYKQYSAARAKTVGANKGKFNFFIPASAEDFTGLLYKMLGKGKKGDAQMAFLKDNLLDPYDRAESAVTQAKIAAANDFKELKNQLKTLPKSLSKPTGIAGFTFSHAVRVAAWTKQGMAIPGLSKKDIKELNDFVKNNDELNTFTNELIVIQKGKPYPKPGDNWLGGNITSDIINGINKVNRAEYQQEWRENVDIIFSEANMNKMEAAYGTRWREAMEDSLRRMKSGSNRPPGGNRVTDGLLDWLNNSVGAVMFLNTRSALLQTISSVNFINWGDNNIVKAGLAFANQKQFWSDFMSLMNSDYLVERRNGLKINVSESEIADAVKDSKNKVKSAIALLLSKGFVMTRFADSFAIATGGATFYRNRVKALIAKGMDQKAAEKQAFDDFRQIAEESQQSSNPNRISAQQASGAGRVILAWANTPMQYARIQKRSAQDLINGRGDWKTNVSKIVYYGAIQNLIFNALQQAVFALGFGEDDEEEMDAKKSEKISRIANGMIDSQLKGLGIGGAAVVALKTALMELGKQHAKDRSKYEEAVFDLLGFSPPLGSKIQKINSGLRSFSWNMKDIKSKGFSLDNPAYLAGAQIVTGLTNIPLDRVMKKLNSMRGIVNEQSALWQKVALGLGWSTWDVGLGYYGGFDAAKVLTPEEQAIEDINTMKKETKTQEQVDMLLSLGLTKKEIKALGKEQARVEKIIELQKAEVTPEAKPEVKPKVKVKVKVEEVKEEPKKKTKPRKETAERKLRRQFDSIKGENKPEQVKSLLGFGLSKKEVRALKYEKDRVEKILELMNK